MRFTFTAKEHEDHGSMGWKPDWMPNGDPYSGMAVAHDVMEHRRNDDGSFADELRALGAALHIRWMGGYWLDKYKTDWGFQISGDMADMLRKAHYDDGPWLRPDDWGTGRRLDEDEEEQIEMGVRETLASLADFEQDERGYIRHRFLNARMLDQIKSLWREGYRNAVRTYPSAWEACGVFRQIEAEADKALKGAEGGETLIVTLTRKDLKAKVWVKEPEYDDY